MQDSDESGSYFERVRRWTVVIVTCILLLGMGLCGWLNTRVIVDAAEKASKAQGRRWTDEDMRRWVNEVERRNPELDIPPPEHEGP